MLLKDPDGKVIRGSVEKRGNEFSGFSYIHNINFKKKLGDIEHIIKKKKNILPTEYFTLLDYKDPNYN